MCIRDRSWLVNLWVDDIHTPYVPSEAQRAAAGDGTGTAAYRAVLRETDRQVGRLLDGLRNLNLDTNTLVILAGDNGPQPSFDRKRTAGLRGMKWSLYEGGIRTPLVVRWPGIVPAGTVNHATVIAAVDLFPTLCALAGLPVPDTVKFDGENLAAAFCGAAVMRTKPLFWEYGRRPAASGPAVIRAFPYPDEPQSKSPNVAMRDGQWKLLVNADGSGAELYDLAADPNEATNLVTLPVAGRLREAALAWRKSLP